MKRLSLAIAIFLTIFIPIGMHGSGLSVESRMQIIRGLTAEYASVRVPLPRGKKGLKLSSNGKIDDESLKREITQNGTAIPPNVLVQITNIIIENKQIILEINGGGIKKTKWYEHVEVGMGSRTTPLSQGDTKTPTGSFVSLVFPERIEDLGVAEIKKYLDQVLNFDPVSPIQALTRPVSKEFQEAIKEKKAVIGMDREMVNAAMGPPQRKVRQVKDGTEQEDWIYGTPPFKTIFVTFEGDEVVNIQEYTGGIRGSAATNTTQDPMQH